MLIHLAVRTFALRRSFFFLNTIQSEESFIYAGKKSFANIRSQSKQNKSKISHQKIIKLFQLFEENFDLFR